MDALRRAETAVWVSVALSVIGGGVGWLFFEPQYLHATEIGILVGAGFGWLLHRFLQLLAMEERLSARHAFRPRLLTEIQQLDAVLRPVARIAASTTPTKRSRITQKLTPMMTPRHPRVSASPERRRAKYE